MDAVREVAHLIGSSLKREARLADAAGTDEGEQAAGRVRKQRRNFGEFVLSADEGRGLCGKAVHDHL
jgi:hypothetical protein